MGIGKFNMFKNVEENTKENFRRILEKFTPNLRLAISGIVLSLFTIPEAKTQSSTQIDRYWLQEYINSDYYINLLKKEILLLKTTNFATLENTSSVGLDTLLKVNPDRILQDDYVLNRTLTNFLEKRKDQLTNNGIIDPSLLEGMYNTNTIAITELIIKTRTTETENTSRFLILLTEFRFLLSKKGLFNYTKNPNFTKEDLENIKSQRDGEVDRIYKILVEILKGNDDDLMFFMNTVAGAEKIFVPDGEKMIKRFNELNQDNNTEVV